MISPRNFEDKIDFVQLRTSLAALCISSMGEARVRKMKYSSDFSQVKMMLEQTAEMLAIITAGMAPPLDGIHDCSEILRQLSVERSYTSSKNLRRINTTLRAAFEIKRFFSSDEVRNCTSTGRLEALADGFEVFPEIISTIDAVVDSVGEVKDNASDLLRQIRRSIMSLQSSVSAAINRAAESAVRLGIVENDTQPVMRDGRLLLPIPASSKRAIPGIVYDQSATGKTVFVQPVEVLEIENRLRRLHSDEEKEIVRILTEVADILRPYIPQLLECWRLLGIFDFTHAKALLAQDLDAQIPVLHKKGDIELFGASHPGLIMSLRQQNRQVVPLNVKLDCKNRILLISGPNAGGKSVALKTVAIVQYMAQCGLLPTVRNNSHLRVFKDIFVDLGDEQSIQIDLSTYSSHLKNMKFMLGHASDNSLIFIDEIGSGTEPKIGSALAQAILDKFLQLGAYGIVTTHYDSLKQFASEASGMVNGAMLYDSNNMQPLFRLQQGNAGSSFALQIAKKIGLPNDVIMLATDIVGKGYVERERYLQQIASDRKMVQQKKVEAEKLADELRIKQNKLEEMLAVINSHRAEMIQEAQEEAKKLLTGANARIERTIKEIRHFQADKEKTREVRKQLQEYIQAVYKKVEDNSPKNNGETQYSCSKSNLKANAKNEKLNVGDYVKTDTSEVIGRILSISGNNAEAAFGPIRMTLKLAKLRKVKSDKKNEVSCGINLSGPHMAMNQENRNRQLNFTPNIDVRGMKVDEAIQAVTYFIDDAAQFEVSPIRILHGTGTGALRSALRQYLSVMPAVLTIRDEDVRLGGAGITVVTLR